MEMSTNLKSGHFFLCVLLWLLCGVFTACSPASLLEDMRGEFELFRAEFAEIMQFADKDYTPSVEESPYVEPALGDTASVPVLETLEHTELLVSPYNSGLWTIFDAGTPDEPKTVPASAQLSGYRHVPLFADRRVSEITSLLAIHGIQVETELRKNPAPAGEVFAIRYAGYSNGNGYYINSDIPVTLYVSDVKAASTREGREQNMIYLTYDDGPTDTDTVRLLDILDSYGVKAAFFTTGEAVRKYPASAKAIVERGHALGCHSVTHQYERIYENVSALEAELVEWEQIVAEAGIVLPNKLFRFPGGSVGSYLTGTKSADMKEMLESHGYTIFDWNVVTNDSLLYLVDDKTDTYDYIRENFIETFSLCLRENAQKENAPIIILMHETVPETIDLMPWMLEYLIGEGFVFGDLATFGESWTFAER